jgi:hypothetical protein
MTWVSNSFSDAFLPDAREIAMLLFGQAVPPGHSPLDVILTLIAHLVICTCAR